MACHMRSISLPTRPHSLVLKIEEELHNLRTCVASPPPTSELVYTRVQQIGEVYQSIEDLLQLPSNQESLSHPCQRGSLEQELDCSISLLDICSTMRDNLAAMKEQIQDLQSALRRGADSNLESKAQAYVRTLKKANKDMKKISKTKDLDSDVPEAAKFLVEAREITVSLLQCIMSCLSRQTIKSKSSSKWSLVSKALQKRRVECDIMEQEQLQNLEADVDALEKGLGCLYRHLIQCRVSLLNICSS